MVMDSGLMWAISVPLAWILALYTSLPLVVFYVILQSIDIVKMGLGLLLVKHGKWANNLTLQVQEPVLISEVNDLLK
jgi:Na+-driven multidrug efflux pump